MIRSGRILSVGRAGLFGVMSLVVLGVACGGSSDTPADGGGDAAVTFTGTPVQLCNKLVSTICTRLKACPGLLMDPASFVEADCEKRANVEFGCDRATATTFPDCLKDVTSVSCAGLFSTTNGLVLPPSCDDPVNSIPLSTAQSKCAEIALADCSNTAMCLGITPTQTQLATCQQEDYAFLGCGDATEVGATFDQCKLDISNAPCPTDGGTSADGGAVAFPASCDTAITFVQ